MEQETDAQPLYFVCAYDRLLPLNVDELRDKFRQPLGKPTYEEVGDWIRKYNARRIEDAYFIVTGEGNVQYIDESFRKRADFRLLTQFMPRYGKGETIADIEDASSRFRQLLRAHHPKERFVHFDIYPNSLHIFEAARKVVESPKFQELTNREVEILELLAKGLTTKKVAEDLFISYATVRCHQKNIYKKLQVHSLMEAVAMFRGEKG